MKKTTQPDTLVMRGALHADCSMWKPLIALVRHAMGVARQGGDSEGAHGDCPEAGVEEAENEGPALADDAGVPGMPD